MVSAQAEKAIEDAILYGKALLKYISPNDLGLTGSHQSGFYLPKKAWNIYTLQGPEKNTNYDHEVNVLWPDGSTTSSMVKWYGKKSRSEYRLTRFGRDFIWRHPDNLGNLLVLIPKELNDFLIYILDTDEDIEELQAALGVEVIDSWVQYEKGVFTEETIDQCLNGSFRRFAETVDALPTGMIFSAKTREAIHECLPDFSNQIIDKKLIKLIQQEYELFKIVERKIQGPRVFRLFESIDDFIDTAKSIMNSRKSRAGRSLENQVEYLLQEAGVTFEMRSRVDNTEPDVLIPGKNEYENPSYPVEKLFMVGVKTTCKDRWRQVLREAPKIKHKHILTLQKGISSNQIHEMEDSNVTLVVPESLHTDYPPDERSKLMTLQNFVSFVNQEIN